jgi:hypothetical protein
MCQPLFYVDQNVIGLQLEGKVDLSKVQGVRWVYSKVHFAEIRRSQTPGKYLDVLEALDAALLELAMKQFTPTGGAILVEAGRPREHFAMFLEAVEEVPFDMSIIDALQAWWNGSNEVELIRQLPERWSSQLESICERLSPDLRRLIIESPGADISALVQQIISQGSDIEKTRAAFGGGKGRLGDIKGDGHLMQIWEIVRQSCGDMTSDEFFGFAPSGGTHEERPLFLGIGACCAVLDMLGYKAERKGRRTEKMPNVRSDAEHIAMGAYCSAIVSADRRLVERAQAIFEYKNIGTTLFLVEVTD